MNRNVEIKARLQDRRSVESVLAGLCREPAQMLQQRDVFFQSIRGRLKLRILSRDYGELIYYNRPDRFEAKLSNYLIARTTDPAALRETLAAALGILGEVRKVRHVYLAGQTRIHLDSVQQLGEYVELEVVLRPDQSEEEGIAIARQLAGRLGIEDRDLVSGAYLDLLASAG